MAYPLVPEAEAYLMAERTALLKAMDDSIRLMSEAASRINEIDREIGRLALLTRLQAECPAALNPSRMAAE